MRIVGRVTLGIVGLLLFGCSSLIPKPETGGKLHVGRPQVFSRERLLNERLGEVNWLRDQLRKEIDPGFQGLQDVRSARAIVQQLNLQFDVLQGRIDGAKKKSDEEAVSRQAERDRAQHQIDLAKLRQQLDDVNNRVKPEAGATQPDETLKAEIQKLQASVKDLSDKIEKLSRPAAASPLPATGAARGLLDPSASRTLSPADALTTGAAPTSKESFEDQAAYRDFVNARIREKILDDSHDLNGSTLYELKFDVTFAPGTHTRRFVLARLKVFDPLEELPNEKIVDDNFVDRVTVVLNQEINEFSKRLQDRARNNALSEAWIRRVLTSFGKLELDKAKSSCQVERLFELFSRFTFTPPLRKPETDQYSEEERNALACLVANFIKNRFEGPLENYFDFSISVVDLPGKKTKKGEEKERFYKVDVRKNTSTRQNMINAVGEIRRDNPPRVATIEPKEYAQNISDVGSRNEASQFGMVLDLLSAKGLGIKSSTERFAQDQNLLQVIKRQPLAVSFLEGSASFGWVLGPKFAIDENQKPTFVHTPARYVFTASIAAPGWMTSVNIDGEGCWIEPDGREDACFKLFGNEGKKFRVNLPSSYHRAFIPALLRHNQEIIREPEVFLLPEQYRAGGTLILRAASEQCRNAVSNRSCEQQVVIEGRELWRNPEVYIGSQKADVVELLPNMRGLVATFRALKPPIAHPAKQNLPEDLLVVTSIGSDRLPRAVTILPDTVRVPKPFMRPRVAYMDKVGNKAALDISFDPAASPPSYYSMLARVRQLEERAFKDVGTPTRVADGIAKFEIDPQAAGLGDKPVTVEIDVGLRFNPEDEFHSMLDPASRFVTYTPNVDDRSVLATDTAALDFSKSASAGAKEQEQIAKRLTYKLPKDAKIFAGAYPGVLAALGGTGGSARLVLIGGDKNVAIPLDARWASDRQGTTLRPTQASIARSAGQVVPRDEGSAIFSVKLEYRLGNADWAEVPIKDGNSVSVKGLKKADKPTIKPPNQ